MEHPTTAEGGWSLGHVIFEDPAGIAVALLQGNNRLMLALRWTEAVESVSRHGQHRLVPWSGSATGWFVLPFTFASAVARTLVELHTSGATPGFNEEGFVAMVAWLVDNSGIADGLGY